MALNFVTMNREGVYFHCRL